MIPPRIYLVTQRREPLPTKTNISLNSAAVLTYNRMHGWKTAFKLMLLNFTYSQKETSLNQHVITSNRPWSNIFFCPFLKSFLWLFCLLCVETAKRRTGGSGEINLKLYKESCDWIQGTWKRRKDRCITDSRFGARLWWWLCWSQWETREETKTQHFYIVRLLMKKCLQKMRGTHCISR